jgi:hypothetical protein
MGELAWIRSHVERCLQDTGGGGELVIDDDGDYPFRWGTAGGWFRVEPTPPHCLRVFAHAAYGVRRSAKLLAELNDVNVRTATAHVYFDKCYVVVEQTMLPHGITRETLSQAATAVGTVGDDMGGMITAVYGGHTPFPAEETVDEEVN